MRVAHDQSATDCSNVDPPGHPTTRQTAKVTNVPHVIQQLNDKTLCATISGVFGHADHVAMQDAARVLIAAVQALEHAAAEDLFHEPRVEVRQPQELSLLCKCAVGDEGMDMGMEVGGVRAERLD